MAMAVWLLLRWNFLLLSWNVCCLPLGPRSWHEDGPMDYYQGEFAGDSWQPLDDGLVYSDPLVYPELTYLEPTSPPSLPEPLVHPERPTYPEPGALTQLEVNLEHGSSETEEQSSELLPMPWLYSEEGLYVSPVRPVPPSPLYPWHYAHNLIGQIPGTISHFSTEYEEGRDHWKDVRYERYDVPPYPPKGSRGPAHLPKIPTRPAHPLKISSDPESSQKLLDDPDNFIPDWVDGAKKLAPRRPLPPSTPSDSAVGQLLGKPAGFIQALKSKRPTWLKRVKAY